jgi:hypothetical protein
MNNYKCTYCKTPIIIHEDCQTGACWTECYNKECSTFGKVFTYVNKDDYLDD